MPDANQFLKAVAASLSADGEAASLEFTRNDGTVAHVHFPTAATGSIVLSIHRALGMLFEKQRQMRGGEDPRIGFAIGSQRVSKIQGAIAVGGLPVISLVLETGVRLDFALPGTLAHDLAEWAQGLEEKSQEAPPKRH